ncbi:hypothetical protein DCAR_0519662 [Daucus carota subsp. sativus]|uniref:Uncharacterized protein n=1 Tax=Daucus carota subsp. sativus TaxID=79200 RepID=A0A164Y475_DAUCS|nr:hypothetical protein DCAR_0519662 [Daucus carota subsp. sativus]
MILICFNIRKLQFKRDPTADEVFYYAHTRRLKKKKNLIVDAEENDMDDEDDEDVEVIWIDKKNQQIYKEENRMVED